MPWIKIPTFQKGLYSPYLLSIVKLWNAEICNKLLLLQLF